MILESNNIDYTDFEIVKFDEKLLSSPRAILRLINKSKYQAVYFGCKENELQRFQIFMKIYIILSLKFKGSVIDESGHKNDFSLIKMIVCELPRLFCEAIVSLLTIIIYYIKIPYLKWTLLKKN